MDKNSYKTLKAKDESLEFYYLLDNKDLLHSDPNFPSLIVNNYISNILNTSYYFSHGVLYRPEIFGAAIISESGHFQAYHCKNMSFAKNNFISENYLKKILKNKLSSPPTDLHSLSNSLRHRIDGPAVIHHKDGASYIHYLQNGLLHRIDGPADVIYNKDKIIQEKWLLEGKVILGAKK